jgi:hypothetical protein
LPPAFDQQRDRLPDDRLGPRRLVDLPRGDFDGEGSARTVRDHMELGSKPALAAAQCVVGGFVGVSGDTFFVSAGRGPGGADAGAVDAPHLREGRLRTTGDRTTESAAGGVAMVDSLLQDDSKCFIRESLLLRKG